MKPDPLALPSRGSTCPPAMVLESLFAGDQTPADVSSHALGCADCGAYLSMLASEQAAFLARRPVELFQRQLARRTAEPKPGLWASWWLRLIPAGAALAALAVVAVPRLNAGDGVGLKGSALSVFVKSPGQDSPRLVLPDARLRAGDLLRFAYNAPENGYLVILDLDSTKHVTAFHPFGGTTPAEIKPFSADVLPGTVALDASPGAEWLVAVFSPHPIDVPKLSQSLTATPAGIDPQLTCAGCRVTTLRIQKEL